MEIAVQFWDQQKFDDALRDYHMVTKRSYAQVLNTKAFYIARKAVWFTAKTNPESIARTLGQVVRGKRTTRTGRTVRTSTVSLVQGDEAEAPLAALMIQSRRRKKNQPGLYGRDMAREIRSLLSARNKSIAYLKSGWLPAVRALERLAGRGNRPAMDNAARQVGREKGSATPAVASDNPFAAIENRAFARHSTKKTNVEVIGGRGLQLAFDDEARSMDEYTERKLAEDAARTNRLLA